MLRNSAGERRGGGFRLCSDAGATAAVRPGAGAGADRGECRAVRRDGPAGRQWSRDGIREGTTAGLASGRAWIGQAGREPAGGGDDRTGGIGRVRFLVGRATTGERRAKVAPSFFSPNHFLEIEIDIENRDRNRE